LRMERAENRSGSRPKPQHRRAKKAVKQKKKKESRTGKQKKVETSKQEFQWDLKKEELGSSKAFHQRKNAARKVGGSVALVHSLSAKRESLFFQGKTIF